MASIRKRSWKSGGEIKTAWVADYFDQDGKRRLKTFATRKAADAWLVQARGEVARGVHTTESASITIAEAAELWIERCKAEVLERSTIRQYRGHVDQHINPLLGSERLARLSVPRVEQFRDALVATRSRPMARKVLTSLKSLIKEAQRRGLIAQNVAREVSIRTSSRHKRQAELGVDIPTKAEVKALLNAVAPRWRPLLVTAVFTGLRASELRGLTWREVDLDARLLRVRQRADRWNQIGPLKSASGRRDVPMSPMVLNALREWKLACPRQGVRKDEDGNVIDPGELVPVFPNGAGRVESLANIWKRGLAPAQLRAGVVSGPKLDDAGEPVLDPEGKPVMLPKYGLHALRHFFASWLIDQGFGPKRVQALMGHSGIQVTLDTYTHLWPAEDDHERFAAGELALVR